MLKNFNMDQEQAYQIASEQIDLEIMEFDHNPKEYLLALGWTVTNYPNIEKLIYKIVPTKTDVQRLAVIINREAKIADEIGYSGAERMLEILQSNSMNDFLCNFIARKIHKLYGK